MPCCRRPAAGARADEAPASAWSGNLTLTSDYLFRGISQTDHRPAVQAELEFDPAGGWYLGGWASNVSWLSDGSTAAQPVSNSLEVDAYAGKRGQFGDGWTWDAGLYGYMYPGHYPHGYTSPQTLEGYGALGWKTLTLKYSRSFGNLFGVADSQGSDYVELRSSSRWRRAGRSRRMQAGNAWPGMRTRAIPTGS